MDKCKGCYYYNRCPYYRFGLLSYRYCEALWLDDISETQENPPPSPGKDTDNYTK